MLEKKDLEQIEKIVGGVENRLNKKIDGVKTELSEKIDSTENRTISILSREITDLAEINHAVINRLDKIAELEKRIMRLEHKAGIVS